MTIEDTTSSTQVGSGISRRSVMKRTALVGGAMVWTLPAVQSIAAPAFAAGSPVAPGCSVSYVVLFIECEGHYYLVKYKGTGSSYNVERCGYFTSSSGDTTRDDAGLAAMLQVAGATSNKLLGLLNTVCPDVAVSGTTFTLHAGCTLQGYIIHDGSIKTEHIYYALLDANGIEQTWGNAPGTVATPDLGRGTFSFGKACS